MQRACIFVDGENLRHSIVDLFRGEFDRQDYLPRNADWSGFFDWLVEQTPWDNCQRVRTYWYVVEKVDFSPWGLKNNLATRIKLNIIKRNKNLRNRIQSLSPTDAESLADTAIRDLINHRQSFDRRFRGWQEVQDGICRNCLSLEFRREGAIRYNLFEKQLGDEKAVDVALGVDMLRLHLNYDVAILLSGDQDYVPAVRAVKDTGRHVAHVSFQTRDNKLLPGGARRLDNVTDFHLQIPYDKVKEFLLPPSV